ncbi:hypothetical protein P154DRAFT_580985 [Amniculicola lignicola CBS 123094]|uniref:Uncharacterized protein n=1 Tax=Amniculicola lignicola CBS 123094 TaxID=1392246 RepID=A0A6A5W884_9PLEO|nr:hypothetical protein P154DRAFT_580985 [Amniculicola lignicola CBS 123094]
MKLFTFLFISVFVVLAVAAAAAAADIDCSACEAKFNICMDLSGSWNLPGCDKICERRACTMDPIQPQARDLNGNRQPGLTHCADCVNAIEACTHNIEGTGPDVATSAEQGCRARVTAFDEGCHEACVGIADL